MVKSMPLIAIMILFLASFINIFIKNIKHIKVVTLISCIINLLFSMYTLNFVNKFEEFSYMVSGWRAPYGIELKINILNSLVSTIIITVAVIIIWFSCLKIEQEVKSNKIKLFYTVFLCLVASIQGMIYSFDLFNIYVFLEISSLTACGLVIVKDKKENIKATLKYLILSLMGSGMFLMGIAFIYSISGYLNITFINEIISQSYNTYSNIIFVSMVLFIVGLGVKAAMFPLHMWLPDAHSTAPSISSAILSALVLKGYVVVLIKIIYQMFGIEIVSKTYILLLLVILGTGGMIIGSILAITQNEFKRMLAYSSVAQMGYIFVGIGLGVYSGLSAAIFHILNHAITKSMLFLLAGIIINKTQSKYIKDYRGIGIEMPITMGMFSIGALSMVGIPLLIGFNSKWYLSLASIDASKPMLVVFVLLSSLLNALYYLPIVINAFFGEENTQNKKLFNKEEKIKDLIPIFILLFGILLFGVMPGLVINMINKFTINLF